MGINTYGRALTDTEINRIFKIIEIPESLEFDEFSFRLDYDILSSSGKKAYSLKLTAERFALLNRLTPTELPLTHHQAETLMKAIGVQLHSPARSLKQDRFLATVPLDKQEKVRKKLMDAINDDMLLLAQSHETINSI